jgi:hypothetical protein
MMLTELARYAVLAAGRRGKIADLVVELGGGPFPPITHILATGLSGKPSVIPWSSVSWIDRKGRTLLLAAGAVDGKRRDALPETAVWLRRDVLDALIVDVRERRVT